MTQRQKHLVRESFLCMREVALPLALSFYGRLFELEPQLRPMFHGDMTRQSVKLMDMLTAVVDNLERVEALHPALQAMGQRHVGYGVTARHYDLVEDALLWAMGQALEADFDPESREAWQVVVRKVSGVMQEGAAAVAP